MPAHVDAQQRSGVSPQLAFQAGPGTCSLLLLCPFSRAVPSVPADPQDCCLCCLCCLCCALAAPPAEPDSHPSRLCKALRGNPRRPLFSKMS